MRKILLFTCFLISLNSHALFLFNPYVGKSSGDFKVGSSEGGLSTTHAGFHAAYQGAIYTLGFDFSYNVHNFAKNFQSANQKYYKGWEWGLLAGISTVGFRFWVASNLSSMRMHARSNGFYFGNNFKVGLGVRVAGDVFLNIESLSNTFDENEIGNGPTNSLTTDIEMNSVMISISVPTYL